MRDHDWFSEKERRPDGAEAQIAMPKNIAPLNRTPQLSDRWLSNNRIRKWFTFAIRRLGNYRNFMAKVDEFFREQPADGFNASYAWGKGMR